MKDYVALVVGIATGVVRDQSIRRRTMLVLTLAALVMLFVGAVFLWDFFAAHPLAFAFYWLVCSWITVCTILLAVYDLLLVFARAREERRAAKKRIFDDKN